MFAVVAGLLFGVLEASLVIPKLVKNKEAFVWQVVPIGAALFGVPLLLVIAFFGVSEYLQFGVYAFFPFLTATAAASGWRFRKFEKENKVDAFMSYFGFEYWTQPTLDYSELFYYFLRDVASKGPHHFWGQLGSSRGYIGYSKIFMDMLKEKPEIDSSTRKNLLKILKTMNKYRYIGLSGLALFIGSISVIMILLFGAGLGYIHLNFNVADIVGPASGIILFSFAIGVLVLMKSFQRTISRLLANIDTSKLALST
ncbi:hypothetical protein JXA31_00290 [Candidatus Bathyarchaeota archaeon]|nr:hypothetical protein [Candidatus Bathyarchaeota archaeon]